MKLELKIIHRQTPKSLRFFVAFFVLMVLGIPVTTFLAERGIFKSHENTIMFLAIGIFIISLVIALIIVTSRGNPPFKTYREVGTLKIGIDSLEVDNKVFPISDLENLKVKYHAFRGERIGRYVSDGTNNYVEYSLNGQSYSQRVLFENDRTLDYLKILLEQWYRKGFRFKEYTKDRRSYLLNNDLTYAQIQEIKKNLNLESWY